MRVLFSFDGKTRHFEWWTASILTSLAAELAYLCAVCFWISNDRSYRWLGSAFMSALVLLCSWIFFACTARRLRDRNRPPWLLLTAFVPYLGWLYLVIECGFMPAHSKNGTKKLVRRQVNGRES